MTRGIVFLAFATLLIAVFMNVAFAADTALTVYTSEGQLVAGSVASAVASAPLPVATNDTATVTVSVMVPDSLAVKLSNTKLNWQVNKAGTYITKAADITTSSNTPSNVTMTVANCANLKQGTAELKTLYKVAPTNLNVTPDNTGFVAAASFNTPVTLTESTMTLWNKLEVPSGTATGTYNDEFSLTFSQSL